MRTRTLLLTLVASFCDALTFVGAGRLFSAGFLAWKFGLADLGLPAGVLLVYFRYIRSTNQPVVV